MIIQQQTLKLNIESAALATGVTALFLAFGANNQEFGNILRCVLNAFAQDA